MKKKIERVEVNAEIWLPEASHFGNILQTNGIKYAIFGAGALAVHNVMIRPTVDIDFVVGDYEKAVEILRQQPDLQSMNLEKERDGIQVADFYFDSGITIQIWDNNMYSLPMTEEAWKRTVFLPVAGFNSIWSISKEDLIASKIGRHAQQFSKSEYEANKNARDIITTIQSLNKPDYNYIIKRLGEGARRETLSKFSSIHNLNWYFAKEIDAYKKLTEALDGKKIEQFVSTILVKSRSSHIEYWMLHRLRKVKSIKKFKTEFMLDGKNCSILLDRWKSIVKINGDKADVSSKDIQEYTKSLKPEIISDYAKKLIFSGKKTSE